MVDVGPLSPQLPVVLPLLAKRQETPRTVTLLFPAPERPDPSFDLPAMAPGQFLLMWLPGVDEKPFTVSSMDEGRFGITAMKRGPFSTRLHDLEPGALVGFRGPYGRGYWGWEELADREDVVLLAGGCGMAPLALLAEKLPRATVVQGAPTARELLFRNRLADQVVCTEDGTGGRRGLPTQWLRETLEARKLAAVYTCGPEAMMATVVEMCRGAGVPCQASMERYMKCGFGVCGQCECDGRLVCLDGPVFSAEELARMPSFGRVRRLKTGQRANVGEEEQCALPSPGASGQ